VVAEGCTGLQISHKQRVFCSLLCPLLQGVAYGLGSSRVKWSLKFVEKVRGLFVAGSFVNQRWQALEDPPNRRGEVPRRDFNLCGGLPIPFTKANIHAGLTHIVLTSMHRTGAKGSSVGPTRRSMQNAGYGLLRIHLPRRWVNKAASSLTAGRRRRGSQLAPILFAPTLRVGTVYGMNFNHMP
jgi:hypothetical protein